MLLAGMTSEVRAQDTVSITPKLVAKANQEQQVTVLYSDPLAAMQSLVRDFNKAYPAITVNLERRPGTVGAYGLLQELNADVHRIDIFNGSDFGANAALVDKKAFAAVEPSNAAAYPASALQMAPFLYSPTVIRTVVLYNPRYVTDTQAESLRRWQGLLDPAFKGKINLVEPSIGGVLTSLAYVAHQPELGIDYLRKLKAQDPAIYVNITQAREAVLSGQQYVSAMAQFDAASITEIGGGAPLRFVYPDPTVEYPGDAWGVLDKAPHPNAARLFFAWLMSRDGALAFQAPEVNTRSVLMGLDDTRSMLHALQGRGWYKEPAAIWRPDMNDLKTSTAALQKMWVSVMQVRN